MSETPQPATERARAEHRQFVDAPIESFAFAVAQLRHAYGQLARGEVVNQAEFARGLVGPAIARLERLSAPVAPLPDSERETALRALVDAAEGYKLMVRGECGVSLLEDNADAALLDTALSAAKALLASPETGWRTAALLKDRTRRAIRDRHVAGDSVSSLAEDYGVPVTFVEALVAWQMGADAPAEGAQ